MRAASDIPALARDPAAAVVAYNADRLGFLLRTARQLGPVVRLWSGLIMVTGTGEVNDVLRQTDRLFLNDRNFLLRKSVHRPGSPELADWLARRRAALAAMTPAMLAGHQTWLAGRAELLTDDLLRQRTTTDVTATLERLTSASIARFCFGSRNADGVPAAAQEMLDALFPIFASPFEFPGYLRLVQPREWRARRRLNMLRAQLHASLTGAGAGGLADVLGSRQLDEQSAVSLLVSIHLAAHGVPAAALSWALVELARNPDQQELAAAAALSWDGSGPIPAVLGWVVDETLRVWPPSWIADRVTEEEATCGSWRIPAGSRVLLPFWVIHRVAGCNAPEMFDVRRWKDLTPPPGSYVPFGGGPRWCLGARFAHAEMTTILAVLLRRTQLSLRGQVRPDARRTLTPRGYELFVTPRQ